MFCIHCGKQIEDGSAFCEFCGGKTEDSPTEKRAGSRKAEGVLEGHGTTCGYDAGNTCSPESGHFHCRKDSPSYGSGAGVGAGYKGGFPSSSNGRNPGEPDFPVKGSPLRGAPGQNKNWQGRTWLPVFIGLLVLAVLVTGGILLLKKSWKEEDEALVQSKAQAALEEAAEAEKKEAREKAKAKKKEQEAKKKEQEGEAKEKEEEKKLKEKQDKAGKPMTPQEILLSKAWLVGPHYDGSFMALDFRKGDKVTMIPAYYDFGQNDTGPPPWDSPRWTKEEPQEWTYYLNGTEISLYMEGDFLWGDMALTFTKDSLTRMVDSNGLDMPCYAIE